MEKYKHLLKNIGLLTISNVATKILSFFLVPLYTSILTTTEYGIFDLVISTVGVLIPLFTINIYEAVLRYSMEKQSNPQDVFSIGVSYCLWGNAIVAILLAINHIFKINSIIDCFAVYFFLIFFVNAISGVIVSMARGLDKIKELSISGVVSSGTIIGLNIFFLCVVKLGINGYFWANILGGMAQIVFLFVCIKGWRYLSLERINKYTKKEMVHYSLPTIANAIAWWINGLSDRYIIVFFQGVAINGIYSVASKIPSILNIFQGIFSQAFMLSAVKEFDEDDNNGFFRKTFSAYNFVLIIVCSMIICFDKVLARFLYSNDFYEAWKYVPFLTISIIFGSLSGYMGSIFAAIKHSEYFAKCSGSGAAVNILLNLVLVPIMGALGASVATAISYWVVYIVSMHLLKKSMNIKVSVVKDNIAYSLLFAQALALLFIINDVIACYIVQTLFMSIEILLYKKEIILLLEKIRKRK